MPYLGGYPHPTMNVLRGQWTFAADGGAQSTIAITGLEIPAGSVIVGGYARVTTVPVGAGASIAISIEGANDVISAAAISGAPWSSTGFKSLVQVGTGATMIVTTAARAIKAVISGADLTAGAFEVTVWYV